MFEQAMLRDLIQEIMDRTENAERTYADLAQQVTDPHMQAQVQLLIRDKQRHLQLTERLLEIVG